MRDPDAWQRPWPAPAKLNLMLRILGRRPDGYHRLQTVFQFVDHCDLIRFRPRADGHIERTSTLPGVAPESDLVVRAARLLQAVSGCRQGAAIDVAKRLPMGGGLGGGSSDAATTLVALDHLWETHLGTDALAELGLQLGADVPVFVRGQAAWGEGVGEELVPLALPEPWYLVVRPPCEVSTAAIFGDEDLTRDSPPITIDDFLSGESSNDCLAVVVRRYPEVAAAMGWLRGWGEAKLTGTGACIFAAFATREQALTAHADVPPECSAFVARGRSRSPLLERLNG
ncbi:4-(cytidine 5'-diphospho)-2-C-methyl-D-erythritol kinase [Thiococcus pfennigii]|jgi:4-diphosphocytidyl-2-C-methyl-D-erythritol kinase|uniref:4-(cytidine 5'-diphospho)-2-C-methyl-D-erythritol kinase n=1 Tax=Thiococcus pfennigii TaxID=1057 RepID=UPI001902D9F4|nr:4-(cytidine 5'-diphospho)-2-C-methyl-D-erythritol kinase [Thiococcus pfennigii]MBK1699697.1 4-(cytidine 5'-diphospho)-2-C-methyl-D-erythritol kinase [Thiococcus pfennigii]MBK1731546.1 4-(cytidine 5'-diphospho)-2-C-methyl-D-erythritol kinase [Thiococcus pfennigii]